MRSLRFVLLRVALMLPPGLLAGIQPCSAAAEEPQRGTWDGVAWADYSPYLTPLDPLVIARIQGIAAAGLRRGRIPGRLGQFGDSISESWAFMRNVLVQGPLRNETGHDYSDVIDWMNPPAAAENAEDPESMTVHLGKGVPYGNRGGWTLEDMIRAGHPARAVERGNGIDAGNFSWAIVGIGSNDIHRESWEALPWRQSLRDFVIDLMALGVVPVLSTVPPRADHADDGRVEIANRLIRDIALELHLPVTDYYRLVTETRAGDWHGTLISDDGVHPSAGGGGRDFSRRGLQETDGYAARSKLVLDMAERLRPVMDESHGR